ncbi:MAG: hypothetical protein ABIG61_05935 [Planctomycetota bacterium]
MRTILICCIMISACATCALAAIGEDFTIGAYYSMPWLEPNDNFSYDYAFMDMARIGCNFAVLSGNVWVANWAALKHWGIKGVTSYNILNGYPGEGAWDPCDFVSGMIQERDRLNGLTYNGEYVGDAVVGHIMTDEPEATGREPTEDQKNYLRAFADVYHQYIPTREIYVNHSDPPWYDLNEKQASCSATTISINNSRIKDRQIAANNIGLENFTVVAHVKSLTLWMDNQCVRIEAFGLGPCTQQVKDWLATRTNYQDVYEELITAYHFEAKGCTFYKYNQHMDDWSIVDINGNDLYGRRAAISDAAHDLRSSQDWPSVVLFNNGIPFNDRGNYPAGDFTLTATADSPSGTIAKVIFGKTTDGGAIWQSIEDTTVPYSATFSASTGQTVIFRAQAVDTNGKKSIYAANMIYINDL